MQIPKAPDVLDGWVRFFIGIATLVGIAITVWFRLLKPLHTRIDKVKSQVENNEKERDKSIARDRGDIDRVDNEIKGNLFSVRTEMQNDVSRISALEKDVERGKDDRRVMRRDIDKNEQNIEAMSAKIDKVNDSLARIETKLGIEK